MGASVIGESKDLQLTHILTLDSVRFRSLQHVLDSGFWLQGSNQAHWLLDHCSRQCSARSCSQPAARRFLLDLRAFCCCKHHSWRRHAGSSNTRYRPSVAMDSHRFDSIHWSLMAALDCDQPFSWEFARGLTQGYSLINGSSKALFLNLVKIVSCSKILSSNLYL